MKESNFQSGLLDGIYIDDKVLNQMNHSYSLWENMTMIKEGRPVKGESL